MPRTEHKKIQVAINVLERLAHYDNKMQLMTALTLLYVARHQNREEGVTTSDIKNWIGLPTSSASRNTFYWADGTPDMPHSGYGLVSVNIDPHDRRRRQLMLTPRGEAFINQLEEVLNG